MGSHWVTFPICGSVQEETAEETDLSIGLFALGIMKNLLFKSWGKENRFLAIISIYSMQRSGSGTILSNTASYEKHFGFS